MHWIIWLVLFIAFLVVEFLTVQMVSLWFSIGALCAGVASLIMDSQNFTVEVITFVVATAITLIVTKPFVNKVTKGNPVPTNADSLIGLTAVVTEEINNIKAEGAVTVKGNTWTARTENDTDSPIPPEKEVEIIKIDGVKLIVKAK